ncbi:hypothetical protein As57867_012375, partial [Aphanomyces stellatus]
MLTDCVPIFGSRRKSWMLLGWVFAILGLGIMAFIPFGSPYCDRTKTTSCPLPYALVPASDQSFFNLDAPNQGSLFILLSMLVSFGSVIAQSASDALVVEYAKREPMAIRGRLLTVCAICRGAAGIPAVLIPAFGLNGVQYNGSFSFALAPN